MVDLKKKLSNRLCGRLCLLALLLCACTEVPELGSARLSGDILIDRDGQRYQTAVIGGQRWMAQNLNYQTNNDPCYDSKLANCETYGRLYNWSAARTACPDGWRLPSDAEWDTLINHAGGPAAAGTRLKSERGWNNNGNGTNDHGFSALPGGGWGGGFGGVGQIGYWWSASEDNVQHAWSRAMYYSNGSVGRASNHKQHMFSVRCVTDADVSR
jgi:uncharacterized protein (TIGR02145 family)